MNFGSFGDIIFKPLFQPSQISQHQQYIYATHKRLLQYPVIEFTAQGLNQKDMTIQLHQDWCNIENTIAYLTKYAQQGALFPLVIGNTFEGFFHITSFKKTKQIRKPDGLLTSCELTLSLIEGKNGVAS